MNERESRVRVVVGDLRRAVDDVVVRHHVDMGELLAVAAWLRQAVDADELELTTVLFAKNVLEWSQGADYADPEIDGASPWEMEGPAHLPGAPVLDSPAVLPMRPDEPGEPLVVSGTVRSTTGEPLAGAVLDVWQIDANDVYSGLTGADLGMPGVTPDVHNDATGMPTFNLRARIAADGDGRYGFRTVTPGVESYGFRPGGPLAILTEALGLSGERPVHIHAIVSADGHLPLTTQIYFDDDPRVTTSVEGPVPAGTVRTPRRHDDPDDLRSHGLDRPYRGLVQDFVLRPRHRAG